MIRLIISLFFALFFFITSLFSQNITGDWYGQLDVQGTKLRINFHVTEKNGSYTTTMDSPDQGAMGLPTTKTIVNNTNLKITMDNLGVTFIGDLKDDHINGIFKQNGMEFPLLLSHNKIKKDKKKPRPQDPKKPYPYKSETVYFINKKASNIKLAGTLTLPKSIKNPPVAILISGSGPQNRDEEIPQFNHRPFLVLSDYLTRNGIAVLRYDDRGVANSEGTQKGATSADFATDVEAAVAYLKTRNDIDTTKIGLIGHSEGGLIAPMVASKNKEIAFIILLAGTGVDGAQILLTQAKKSGELTGLSKEYLDFNEATSKKVFTMIQKSTHADDIKKEIIVLLKEAKKEAPAALANELTDTAILNQATLISSPWFVYFIKTNPNQFLSKVNCPVLALNGSKDVQVLPKLNLIGIEQSLKKASNNDVTILELEELNHLFQTCKTGASSEYAQIEETFSPKALKIITDWINERF